MESFSTRLRILRESKKLRQEDIGALFDFGKSTISQWESGGREPDFDVVVELAKYFHVSTDYLLGLTDNPTSSVPHGAAKRTFSDLKGLTKDGLITVEMVEVPVYRLDVKGEEILADSNIIGRHYVPAEQMDCICFRVPDDSMSGSGLYTDYIVTVKKQTTAEDGQMVIVKTKDGLARIRRVRYFNDEVLLDPDNPRYQSDHININELDIIGVVTDASFKVK